MQHKETARPAARRGLRRLKITLPPGAAQPPAPFEGEGWQAMFDGQTLAGWRETAFAGHGEVHCQDGVIVLGMGDPFTGINWTNDFPKMNYEVALDAMRLMGSDFFCGLTVPVGDQLLQPDCRRLGRLAGRHLQPGWHGRVRERDDQVHQL